MSEYCKNCYELAEQLHRYKQAIKDIKEIAEILLSTTNEYDNCYYKDKCYRCRFTDDCQYIKVEQILQKIRKCEVGNKYNTKDIMHINEKNQEYIAEGNRMTKKII